MVKVSRDGHLLILVAAAFFGKFLTDYFDENSWMEGIVAALAMNAVGFYLTQKVFGLWRTLALWAVIFGLSGLWLVLRIYG